jgi:hypothetical protein
MPRVHYLPDDTTVISQPTESILHKERVEVNTFEAVVLAGRMHPCTLYEVTGTKQQVLRR